MAFRNFPVVCPHCQHCVVVLRHIVTWQRQDLQMGVELLRIVCYVNTSMPSALAAHFQVHQDIHALSVSTSFICNVFWPHQNNAWNPWASSTFHTGGFWTGSSVRLPKCTSMNRHDSIMFLKVSCKKVSELGGTPYRRKGQQHGKRCCNACLAHYGFITLQNHLDWKRTLKSLSPATHLTLQVSPTFSPRPRAVVLHIRNSQMAKEVIGRNLSRDL